MVVLKDEFMKGRPCLGHETHGISFSPKSCCSGASVSSRLQSGPTFFLLLITSCARHSRWGDCWGAGSALLCQRETEATPSVLPVRCREHTEGTPLWSLRTRFPGEMLMPQSPHPARSKARRALNPWKQ